MLQDNALPLDFFFKKRKELNSQDQPFGLKKVVSQGTIFDSQFFKGDSNAPQNIYPCLPDGNLSPKGKRQRFSEDIRVKVGIKEIVEEEVSDHPDNEDRNHYPEKKPFFAMNHLFEIFQVADLKLKDYQLNPEI